MAPPVAPTNGITVAGPGGAAISISGRDVIVIVMMAAALGGSLYLQERRVQSTVQLVSHEHQIIMDTLRDLGRNCER